MLIVAFRRVVRRGDQRRFLQCQRQRRGLACARSVGREQRNTSQLVIREIGDTAWISGDAHQIAVMHHHDLAIARHLQVKFDAVPGFTGGCERGKRILRSDHAGDVRAAVSGFHGHAAGERHVFAAFVGILRGQAGTGVMQAAVRVPHVRNGRHIVAPLVGEGTRGDRPHRGSRRHRTAEQRFLEKRL